MKWTCGQTQLIIAIIIYECCIKDFLEVPEASSLSDIKVLLILSRVWGDYRRGLD
jgi:hypothetical protein